MKRKAPPASLRPTLTAISRDPKDDAAVLIRLALPCWILYIVKVLRFALLASFGILWAYSVNAASISVLSGLPGGVGTSTVLGISADGSTAFGSSRSQFGMEAFRWDEDAGLLGLGNFIGGYGSWALGSNASGELLCGWGSASGQFAFRGTFPQLNMLLPVTGSTQVIRSRANAISDEFPITVGFSDTVPFGQRATVWHPDNASFGAVLDDLIGGPVSGEAMGISGDGTRIVGWSRSAAGAEATYWDSVAVTSIGDFPGGTVNARANACTVDGTILVGRGTRTDGVAAFLWDATSGMQTLKHANSRAASVNSEAFDISARGDVIVGRAVIAGVDQAFVWTKNRNMMSLRQLLMSQGVDVTGKTFTDARGVSGDGLTIVGNGVFDGISTGYVARLDPFYPSISGTVRNFSDNQWPNMHPATVLLEVIQSGGVVESRNITLRSHGRYFLLTSLRGEMRIALTWRPGLRILSAPFTLTDTEVTDIDFNLVMGDSDGSGEIDAADADAVIAGLGTDITQYGYSMRIDFDGNELVNVADLMTVIRNFGKVDE